MRLLRPLAPYQIIRYDLGVQTVFEGTGEVPGYISDQYKPAELKAACEALQKNGFHDFHERDAYSIIIALHKLGYRIVKTGKQK